ncbi:MAG: tRNA pseudouridine(55) synthase TruB [Deltaproteobacteria bacterium]|nr:tRNA pseudouridine(55) synthase TruB [Deltaproteobacteria bacterium]
MDGILVMNKPAGMTSATLVSKVKRILGGPKVGHTGTLDPFATGVLVLCVGAATRLARFFLHGDKTYDATLALGVTTDTQDPTGQVVDTREVPDLSEDEIKEAFAGFVGEIEQTPPVYSALKHNGVPLYKLARSGKPVQKPPRKVTIHWIDVTGVDLPRVTFSAHCSGGTYIRTLCADVGGRLGCGGHLSELRRTNNSGFSIDEALDLQTLKEMARSGKAAEALIPMADALPRMPEFLAGPGVAGKIANGQEILWEELVPADKGQEEFDPQHVKVVDAQRNLLAVMGPRPDGEGLSYCCVFGGRK